MGQRVYRQKPNFFLEGIQTRADKIEVLPDGSTRYYDKFRPARTEGPTAGSRFVVERGPETGEVKTWNETYDQSGVVNRISLKTINGVGIDALHFPPTLSDLVDNGFMPRPSF